MKDAIGRLTKDIHVIQSYYNKPGHEEVLWQPQLRITDEEHSGL